ncbi:MAG: endonuclease domain-containing protein [Candidatus Bipolaricaulota bacterium]|nr:endonuclease domain-containing protein [Candidatus Bipolaricaulota bacterium]MDW8127419.1 hypothetical protein [Candidatus Bipolaricaulota bacterium]
MSRGERGGKKGQRSSLEEDFLFALRVFGLPAPVREHRFHPKRRWQFDFAWPEAKVYVEIEGGTFSGGRHVRPLAYSRDCEKYNHATLAGWAGLRFTTDMLRGDPVGCVRLVAELLTSRGVELEAPGLDFPEDLAELALSCARPGKCAGKETRKG